MRLFLNWMYRGCGILAGVFLALIAVLVLVQIIGRNLGLLITGSDTLACYSLAATSLLALPYTLRSGGHIRVELLLRQLNLPTRRIFELWCLAGASFIASYATLFAAILVRESYILKNTATGMLALPVWIPQCAMLLGLGVLSFSFIEELIRVLRGHKPSYGYANPDESQLTAGVTKKR